MSKGTPEGPQAPLPPGGRGGPPERPRGGSMGLGAVLGALALYVFYVGSAFAAGPNAWTGGGLGGWVVFVPIAVYLAAAIVLAVRRETSYVGAGLLIGLGVFTLLGGGLCVAALYQAGA